LLDTVREPEIVPAVVGEKPTVNGTAWPADRVNGVDRLERVNPAPAILTAETVTAEAPVLVILTDWDWDVLTVTLPMLSEAGLEDSRPSWAATAVPVSETETLGDDVALLVKATLPVAVPTEVGE